MLEEMLRAVPWWGFALTALLGVGFGALQVVLAHRAMADGKPKPWLFVVKLTLWAMLLVALGFLSVPLMILFGLVGSAVLLGGTALLYRKAQKDEVN